MPKIPCIRTITSTSDHDKKVYFVAETKGVNNIDDPSLSDAERFKIKCGKRHFENFDKIEFKGPVTKLSEVVSD